MWNKFWGYIYAQDIAPIWVGEFGTDNTASDIESSTAGSQGQWFESLVAYLAANPWMGWTYWALNGEDSYDLLDSNYDPTPVSSLKQSLLAGIEFPLPGASRAHRLPRRLRHRRVRPRTPWSTPGPAASRPRSSLTNTGTVALSSWALSWTFPGSQELSGDWSGVFTQSGANVSVTNEPYNGDVAPGAPSQSGSPLAAPRHRQPLVACST